MAKTQQKSGQPWWLAIAAVVVIVLAVVLGAALMKPKTPKKLDYTGDTAAGGPTTAQPAQQLPGGPAGQQQPQPGKQMSSGPGKGL